MKTDDHAFEPRKKIGIYYFAIMFVACAILWYFSVTKGLNPFVPFGLQIYMAALVICSIGYYRSANPSFWGNLSAIAFYFVNFQANPHGGGITAPAMVAMTAFPPIATAVCGRKSGLFWGAVSLLWVSFLYFGEMYGFPIENTSTPELLRFSFWLIILIMIFVTVPIAYTYDLYQSRALQIRKDREARLLLKDLENRILLRVLFHDLANPLTVALGSYQILDHTLKEKDAKASERISSSLMRMGAILKSIRSLHYGGADGRRWEFEPVNLADCLEDLKRNFADFLLEKSMRLIIEELPDKGELNFRGDRRIVVDHVLGNVISNAIKFSQPGSSIAMKVSRDSQYLHLEISDNGRGMAKDLTDQLFTSERIPSTPGTNGEVGSGFGLNIAYSFMKFMSGMINVHSSTDEGTHGTTVRLSFALADRDVDFHVPLSAGRPVGTSTNLSHDRQSRGH